MVLQKGEILKICTKKIIKNKCRIGNILVEVVPEGCIFEIKLITLALKHISSKYSPTKEIWPPLLRGLCTVAIEIFSEFFLELILFELA